MENANNKGMVFNIQKFSIHDGIGIRTLVFMKGCPLKCDWCSNPESQGYDKELMFVRKNCNGCGKCVEKCPQSCVNGHGFTIDRSKCKLCGQCTKYCYTKAKKMVGTEMSVYEVVNEIEKDRAFYLNSQGGVTVGGGEPTAQPEFVAALLKECKRLALHTAIETCGFGKWDKIGKVLGIPDQIFFDLKHMDAQKHQRLTGVDNGSILDNAKRIVQLDKDITFRIPLIPGCNDTEANITETGKFVAGLTGKENDVKVEILAYHALGADKYKWMDVDYNLDQTKTPPDQVVQKHTKTLKDLGCKVVEAKSSV